MADFEDHFSDQDPVKIEINGILDLHHFSPKELKHLIPGYIEECLALNIFEVRFIHGKGIGNIRRTVHSLLEKNRSVKCYRLAGNDAGGWGATIVELHPPETCR